MTAEHEIDGSQTAVLAPECSVDVIQNIAQPTNKKQLRKFIGMVNYYSDMWISRSEISPPPK